MLVQSDFNLGEKIDVFDCYGSWIGDGILTEVEQSYRIEQGQRVCFLTPLTALVRGQNISLKNRFIVPKCVDNTIEQLAWEKR